MAYVDSSGKTHVSVSEAASGYAAKHTASRNASGQIVGDSTGSRYVREQETKRNAAVEQASKLEAAKKQTTNFFSRDRAGNVTIAQTGERVRQTQSIVNQVKKFGNTNANKQSLVSYAKNLYGAGKSIAAGKELTDKQRAAVDRFSTNKEFRHSNIAKEIDRSGKGLSTWLKKKTYAVEATKATENIPVVGSVVQGLYSVTDVGNAAGEVAYGIERWTQKNENAPGGSSFLPSIPVGAGIVVQSFEDDPIRFATELVVMDGVGKVAGKAKVKTIDGVGKTKSAVSNYVKSAKPLDDAGNFDITNFAKGRPNDLTNIKTENTVSERNIPKLKKKLARLEKSSPENRAEIRGLKRVIRASENSTKKGRAVESLGKENYSNVKEIASMKGFDAELTKLRDMKSFADNYMVEGKYVNSGITESAAENVLARLTKSELSELQALNEGTTVAAKRSAKIKENKALHTKRNREIRTKRAIEKVKHPVDKAVKKLNERFTKRERQVEFDEFTFKKNLDDALGDYNKKLQSGTQNDRIFDEVLESKKTQLFDRKLRELKSDAEFDKALAELKEMKTFSDNYMAEGKYKNVAEKQFTESNLQEALDGIKLSEKLEIDAMNQGKTRTQIVKEKAGRRKKIERDWKIKRPVQKVKTGISKAGKSVESNKYVKSAVSKVKKAIPTKNIVKDPKVDEYALLKDIDSEVSAYRKAQSTAEKRTLADKEFDAELENLKVKEFDDVLEFDKRLAELREMKKFADSLMEEGKYKNVRKSEHKQISATKIRRSRESLKKAREIEHAKAKEILRDARKTKENDVLPSDITDVKGYRRAKQMSSKLTMKDIAKQKAMKKYGAGVEPGRYDAFKESMREFNKEADARRNKKPLNDMNTPENEFYDITNNIKQVEIDLGEVAKTIEESQHIPKSSRIYEFKKEVVSKQRSDIIDKNIDTYKSERERLFGAVRKIESEIGVTNKAKKSKNPWAGQKPSDTKVDIDLPDAAKLKKLQSEIEVSSQAKKSGNPWKGQKTEVSKQTKINLEKLGSKAEQNRLQIAAEKAVDEIDAVRKAKKSKNPYAGQRPQEKSYASIGKLETPSEVARLKLEVNKMEEALKIQNEAKRSSNPYKGQPKKSSSEKYTNLYETPSERARLSKLVNDAEKSISDRKQFKRSPTKRHDAQRDSFSKAKERSKQRNEEIRGSYENTGGTAKATSSGDQQLLQIQKSELKIEQKPKVEIEKVKAKVNAKRRRTTQEEKVTAKAKARVKTKSEEQPNKLKTKGAVKKPRVNDPDIKLPVMIRVPNRSRSDDAMPFTRGAIHNDVKPMNAVSERLDAVVHVVPHSGTKNDTKPDIKTDVKNDTKTDVKQANDVIPKTKEDGVSKQIVTPREKVILPYARRKKTPITDDVPDVSNRGAHRTIKNTLGNMESFFGGPSAPKRKTSATRRKVATKNPTTKRKATPKKRTTKQKSKTR